MLNLMMMVMMERVAKTVLLGDDHAGHDGENADVSVVVMILPIMVTVTMAVVMEISLTMVLMLLLVFVDDDLVPGRQRCCCWRWRR